MLPRKLIAPGILLLAGFFAVPAMGSPFAASPDGNTVGSRTVSLGPAQAASTTEVCFLDASHNALYPEQGYVYFFSCEGDEIARRVDFTECVTNSYCHTWYPRTVKVSFWISAAQCSGTYPYTTSAFDVQLAIYPVDPFNPQPEIPVPSETPSTMSAVVRIPPLTRTSASGADALVTVSLPFYGDCLHSSPFYIVFKWVHIDPADDYCAGAPCAGRLPGIVSTGSCQTPGCTGPNDPADTLTPYATFFRNMNLGPTEWMEAGAAGIKSDISISLDLSCCDAIDVQRSTWGRIKSLQSR